MPFINPADLPAKEPLPGWQGRFLNTQHMTFGYYQVATGATIHEHSHPNEEVWHIIEGQLEVTIDGEMQVAGSGCYAVIPPNTLHEIRALTDARAIVVDHPRRESVGGVSTA